MFTPHFAKNKREGKGTLESLGICFYRGHVQNVKVFLSSSISVPSLCCLLTFFSQLKAQTFNLQYMNRMYSNLHWGFVSCNGRLHSHSAGNEILSRKIRRFFKCLFSDGWFSWFFCVIARKKLEQVENGGCDREGSSMGSRSSSSGTPSFSASSNLNSAVIMLTNHNAGNHILSRSCRLPCSHRSSSYLSFLLLVSLVCLSSTSWSILVLYSWCQWLPSAVWGWLLFAVWCDCHLNAFSETLVPFFLSMF